MRLGCNVAKLGVETKSERKARAASKRLLVEGVAKVGYERSRTLEARDASRAVKVLEMLADGRTCSYIRRELGVDFDTILRIKKDHAQTIEARRRILAEDALEITEGLRLLQREKMRQLAESPDKLESVNMRDLTLPWAIAQDKVFAAMGENKTVVEHRGSAPSLEDAVKAIEAARAKLKNVTQADTAAAIEVSAEATNL